MENLSFLVSVVSRKPRNATPPTQRRVETGSEHFDVAPASASRTQFIRFRVDHASCTHSESAILTANNCWSHVQVEAMAMYVHKQTRGS